MSVAQLFQTPELAGIGPDVRLGRDSITTLQTRMAAAFSKRKLNGPAQSLIRSAALLWHDHIDESHTVSQDIESIDGSFLHGIMHRREPDYSNAKYWFRLVGEHPSHPEIARRVCALLADANAANLKDRLLPAGRWDSFAMVDAVDQSMRKGKSSNELHLLQRVQQIEFEVLTDRFCAMD